MLPFLFLEISDRCYSRSSRSSILCHRTCQIKCVANFLTMESGYSLNLKGLFSECLNKTFWLDEDQPHGFRISAVLDVFEDILKQIIVLYFRYTMTIHSHYRWLILCLLDQDLGKVHVRSPAQFSVQIHFKSVFNHTHTHTHTRARTHTMIPMIPILSERKIKKS